MSLSFCLIFLYNGGMSYIELKGKKYPYYLSRRKMRSMSATVRGGVIEVHAPYHVETSVVEAFLKKHEEKFVKAIEAFKPLYDFRDGGFVYIFGKRYALKHVVDQRAIVEEHGNYLDIHSYDFEKTLSQYLARKLYGYLQTRISYYLQHDFALSMPRIIVKPYRSRWGSCYYERQEVAFNCMLVHFDTRVIDSVIIHELCHFLVSNHSKTFYQEVYKRMPDYDYWHEQLRGAL